MAAGGAESDKRESLLMNDARIVAGKCLDRGVSVVINKGGACGDCHTSMKERCPSVEKSVRGT